ncbi:beta-glucan synthesis-associated protein [Daedaleopsis nitida]|nr:beta-glucan synthesis-associated protein [Daedaleopsis nitida]
MSRGYTPAPSLLQAQEPVERRPPGIRWGSAATATPLSSIVDSRHESYSEKFLGMPMNPLGQYTGPEDDDRLHNPDLVRDKKSDGGGTFCTSRGLVNLGTIAFIFAGMVALFGGYPIITFFTTHKLSFLGGFNIGGTNETGQIPDIPGNWGLIDKETPLELRQKQDYRTGKTWQLIFSDEFNVDGRTFYPGDDPYWEAVDLHYWATGNLEWYDPSTIMTRNGSLEIQLLKKPNHDLDYMGGMISTWNKFCFTGGLVEASIMLPGSNNIHGLWPAVWAMGNLGRAGYGASLDGLWPYSYDTCDVGTVANQTYLGEPVAATIDNDEYHDGALSYQPGQRLSRCTCPGESHPGPVHAKTGEYVGRSAPEIDIFEAQIGGSPMGDKYGAVSQSGQWAPFNYQYKFNNNSDTLIIEDPTISQLNGYTGGVYQQATSVVSATNQEAYELTGFQYAVYGFQYKPGFGDAYISWINDGELAWTLTQPGMGPDAISQISDRAVPQEPLYLLMNLGISEAFGLVDFEHLTFPATMRIDWVRVYQDPDAPNIGCDPPDFPTQAYIDTYKEAYYNPLLTTWVDDYHQEIPKNRFLGQC